MSATKYFERHPVYTAQRLYSEGQGKEANPFAYDTIAREDFDAEIERLQLEEAKQEAMQP
jgi:hypothetical protein